MKYLTDYNFEDMTDLILELGGKKFTARQVWSWLYRKNVSDFDEMTDIAAAVRQRLKERFPIRPFREIYSQKSSDGTEKFLLTLNDGNSIEAVLIPEKNRVTICVSSQVGCKFACAFCARIKNEH